MVLNLKLPKNPFNKKCANKFLFFNENKNSKQFAWFLTSKIHFGSPIFAHCDKVVKLGKACWGAYNRGEWIIL